MFFYEYVPEKNYEIKFNSSKPKNIQITNYETKVSTKKRKSERPKNKKVKRKSKIC